MYRFPLADCHVHTTYSFDGKSTLIQQLDRACELGLGVIAITDHLDIVPDAFEKEKKNHLARAEEIEKIRPEYPQLKILCGLEIGQAVHYPYLTEEYLKMYKWDFVLGSIHNLRNREDFYFSDFTKTDPDAAYRLYLDEILETVNMGAFDSLAHLTYPLRYIVGRDGIEMPYERYKKRYDEILSLLIEKGKALEINTTAIKNGGTPSPEIEIIKRYSEMGGKLITLGSDAHEAKYLTSDFNTVRKMLAETEIKSYVYFENRTIAGEFSL